MELIRDLHNLKKNNGHCVATIGNFDGIHIGHHKILQQLKEKSAQLKLPSTVVLFEPQPQEFFKPDTAPARVMRFRDKVEKLAQMDIDCTLCLRFNHRLANLKAEEFIDRVLVSGLGVRYLIVGHDFRFGKGRKGDFHLLESYGEQHDFSVVLTEACKINDRRVSSTWLREALGAGDMNLAAELLGHPFSISGRIVHGDKRGKELGYPTININLHRLHSPVSGIFISQVIGLDERPLPAVTSIGTRPVFEGAQMNMETYILDFDRDVYGYRVRVELFDKIREEMAFIGIEELRNAIEQDVEETKKYFGL